MRPQAVTRRDWRGLTITCALWSLGLAVSAVCIYIIATAPAGWWLDGSSPLWNR